MYVCAITHTSSGVIHTEPSILAHMARIGRHCSISTTSQLIRAASWKPIIAHSNILHARSCVSCSNRQATEILAKHDAHSATMKTMKVVTPMTSRSSWLSTLAGRPKPRATATVVSTMQINSATCSVLDAVSVARGTREKTWGAHEGDSDGMVGDIETILRTDPRPDSYSVDDGGDDEERD